MPVITLGSRRFYYRLDGSDGRPVLVLSHSLGLDHTQWDPQVAALAPHLRILRFDTLGHGGSDAPPGDYTMDDLGRQALALLDALEIDRFAFCGLSMGGMTGLWLAAHVPARVSSLILANSSAKPDAKAMEARRLAVLQGGTASVEPQVMGRFFTARSLAANPPHVAGARRTLLATNTLGYAGCCAAVRDFDLTGALDRLKVPTLVISGNFDPSLPWAGHSDRLAASIPGAKVVHLPTAHISNLEAPATFTAALADLLLPAPAGTYEEGLAVRREVLGDAYVNRATTATTDFTREFQELITKYAWGTIWTRPGLDRRTRRLLVLAMTASLSRWEEFRLHLEAGLAHELEPADVKEALLAVAAYAGIPAANAAFNIAAGVEWRKTDA
jgi:3-oxoadipate enol-lactonase/4-carboxymuconolactone decarboxylase